MPLAPTSYVVSEELRKLAEEGVKEVPGLGISQDDIDSIVFVEVKSARRTKYLGRYTPIGGIYEVLTDYEAFIQINVDQIREKVATEQQERELLKRVLVHELLHHIQGEHDVQDFAVLLNKWGLGYIEGLEVD